MHCLQAAVMMVLNTLDGPASWEEVNEMTKYEEGKYSWTPAATVTLAERLPGTKLISNLDYRQFAERGEAYLREYWDPAWYNDQKSYASPGFVREQQFAKNLVAKGLFEHRPIDRTEIERLLMDHLLIASVNASRLSGEEDTVGHLVVIYENLGDAFELHDPGLPPHPHWRVNKNVFAQTFQNELIVVPRGGFRSGAALSRNDPCWCGSGKKFKKCHGD
ncbi:SEC-C domain-containing protein [Candidatus Parcubacteria bacterium]|nr:SEC-C domain-containing protein [Candidatus Parcubacteria bacterium]